MPSGREIPETAISSQITALNRAPFKQIGGKHSRCTAHSFGSTAVSMSPRLTTQLQERAPLPLEPNMRTTIEHEPVPSSSTSSSPDQSDVASTILARAAFALDNSSQTALTPNSPPPDLLKNQPPAIDELQHISDKKRKRKLTESYTQTGPVKETHWGSSSTTVVAVVGQVHSAQGPSSVESGVSTVQCGEPQMGSVV